MLADGKLYVGTEDGAGLEVREEPPVLAAGEPARPRHDTDGR